MLASNRPAAVGGVERVTMWGRVAATYMLKALVIIIIVIAVIIAQIETIRTTHTASTIIPIVSSTALKPLIMTAIVTVDITLIITLRARVRIKVWIATVLISRLTHLVLLCQHCSISLAHC